jgi:prepilin-type N-terminal cleavage/methylation domain-containing protein
MTSTPRTEDGFSLPEMLIVMVTFLIILGATLTTFNQFERTSKRSQSLSENVEESRRALDALSRQLRNIAKRYFKTDLVITRAEGDDLVFQTSDPSKKWVRYCVDTSFSGTPSAGILWTGESAGALPGWMTSTGCDGASWPGAAGHQVGHLIVNGYPVTFPQPIFTYACGDLKPASCPASPADYGSIKSISMQLLVDQKVDSAPAPTRVATSVYLRNQNEGPRFAPPPATAFTYRLNPLEDKDQVILNGSGASDPEGRTLRFFWFVGDPPSFTCDKPPSAEQILSRSVTYTYTFANPTPVRFSLVVCDPGDLQAIAPTQTIGP